MIKIFTYYLFVLFFKTADMFNVFRTFGIDLWGPQKILIRQKFI